MAEILCVTRGLPSVVYPSVELARRLAVAGHRLTFAGDPEYRGLAEHHGLAFLALESNHYQEFLKGDARAGRLKRLLNLRQRRQRAADAMSVSGFVQDVRRLAPDLILIDGEMHEHIIAVSPAGAPLVLLNSFASIWKQSGLPPAHCLVRPGVGWRGTRLGISMLWLALRWRKWGKAVGQHMRRVGCDRLSILRHLAQDADFNLRRETDANQWLIPFTYRHLPVLSLHAQEFEFPHRPPRRVHYVGPMLLESRVDRRTTEGDPPRLEAILARHQHGRGQRKLIYAGFGSVFSTDLSFLKRLLGIADQRPDWDLVISLSDRIAADDLGALPERVHVFPWVDQRRVIQHADAVITHGGINTLDECVASGVPTLIYCGFETDMAGNTARVAHHGIGLVGDRQRDNTPTIQGRIDRLLSEPRFEDNLKRLRRSYAAYAEDRVAERVVHSLLESGGEDL